MNIQIRQAQESDKNRMLEISSHIWEGHDYIPLIADYWIAGNGGVLWVAEADGIVQGFSRMTYLRPNTSWMEGIRVSQESRGLGIGKSLTAFQIKKSFEEGFDHCELSSYVENYESLAIVEKHGFKRIASFKLFEWFRSELIDDRLQEVQTVVEKRLEQVTIRPVTEKEHKKVFNRIIDSPIFRRRENYFSFDWTFEHADSSLIALLIERGELYWLIEENEPEEEWGIFSLSSRFTKGQYHTLNFVSRPSLIPMASAFAVKRALELGEAQTCFMAVDQSMSRSFNEIGFITHNDQIQDVFVYRLNREL